MDNGADSYRRFLAGDDSGLVEIVRDYKDGLILFLNRYVRNIHIAEELAKDTFVRIVTKKPCFPPRTFLQNMAIYHREKHRQQRPEASAQSSGHLHGGFGVPCKRRGDAGARLSA